jgi:hypothetical protein
MSMTSIYPILGLDKESNKLKKQDKSSPPSTTDIDSLLEQYKKLLEISEKISSTVLIKHNNWIVQVKSIRQHYLFETEESLTEEQSMAKCAIEIASRDTKQNGLKTLYSIRCNDKGTGITLSNEQTDGKSLQIKLDDQQWISKLIGALK